MDAILYLLLVAAVAARRPRCDERSFVHIVLVYAPGAAWLAPLAWLLPSALWEHDVRSVVVDLLTVGIVVFGLMDFRFGPTPRMHPAGRRLRVATFNVYGGSIDITPCVAFLKACEADVIFLQEAWWTGRYRVAETLPLILGTFSDWHVFRSDDEHEMMILSRHPISDARQRTVANRPCLVCTLQAPSGEVRLINVHLDPPATRRTLRRSGKPVLQFFLDTARAREAQGDALRALVEESDVPTVVAGDFNSPPHAYARRVLRPVLRDAFATTGHGFGYTYPHPLPLWRIDYILVSPSIVPDTCDVPRVKGSDHLPLVANLRLP